MKGIHDHCKTDWREAETNNKCGSDVQQAAHSHVHPNAGQRVQIWVVLICKH
jgi:hypothetical protein